MNMKRSRMSQAIIGILAAWATGASLTVNAEVKIDRFPPVTGGEEGIKISSPGVKPNVFLIFDNSGSMDELVESVTELNIDGVTIKNNKGFRRMHIVAAGVRNGFKKLEGKVRLGFAALNKPTFSTHSYTLEGILPKPLKLGLLDTHSGLRRQYNVVPREFSGEYADDFYKWVGNIYPWGGTNIELAYSKVLASIMTNRGWLGNNESIEPVPLEKTAPSGAALDFFADTVDDPSNEDYGWPVLKKNGDKDNVRTCRANFAIIVADGGYNGYYNFDIVGDYRPKIDYLDDQFDDGSSKPPSRFPKPLPQKPRNFDEQVHNLPVSLEVNGKTYTQYNPNNPTYGYIYRDSANNNYYNINDNPDYTALSDIVFFGWINDLRRDLKNDVPPYWHKKDDDGKPVPRVQGIKGAEIPVVWDRKNDPATWQHLTTFTIGLTSGVPSWQNLRELYNPFYPELNKKFDQKPFFNMHEELSQYVANAVEEVPDPLNPGKKIKESWIEDSVEGYFRAIEDGTIYSMSEALKRQGLYNGDPVYNLLEKRFYTYEKDTDDFVDRRTLYAKGYVFNKMGKLDASEAKKYYREANRPHNQYDYAWRANSSKYAIDTSEIDFAKSAMMGRGDALSANDPDSLEKAIARIAKRIDAAYNATLPLKSTVSGTVSSNSIISTQKTDTMLYSAEVNATEYTGNVKGYKLCANQDSSCGKNGIVEQPVWNAADRLYEVLSSNNNQGYQILRNKIYTIGATGKGTEFLWDNLSAQQKEQITDGDEVEIGKGRVEYLQGKFVRNSKAGAKDGDVDASVEDDTTLSPELYRQRGKTSNNKPNVIGEIIYSKPDFIDNSGTLGNLHPLRGTEKYRKFLKEEVEGHNGSGARDKLVIFGSNDGKVYALNADTGRVAFQYIPLGAYPKLADTTKLSFHGDTLVGGKFEVKDVQFSDGSWHTLAVGSMGSGGKSIFAFDLNKSSLNNPKKLILWEKTASEVLNAGTGATLEKTLGHVMAKPRIVWLADRTTSDNKKDGKWVVLIPNGYNSNGNSASLIVLDAESGNILAEIDTKAVAPEGEDNGLGPLTVQDIDGDGGADFVYAGDLQGNVWKFDLTGWKEGQYGLAYQNQAYKTSLENYVNAKRVYDEASPETKEAKRKLMNEAYESIKAAIPILVAMDSDKKRRPITSEITIAGSPDGEGTMLYFGTGKLLSTFDAQVSQQQAFYAVNDNYRVLQKKIPHMPSDSSKPVALITQNDLFPKILFDISSHKANLNNDDKRKEWLNTFDGNVNGNGGSIRGIKDKNSTNLSDQGKTSSFKIVDLAADKNDSVNKFGWYLEFPRESFDVYDETGNLLNSNGGYRERVANEPIILDDELYFMSFSPRQGRHVVEDGGSCNAAEIKYVGGSAGITRFYMLNRLKGTYLNKSPFDLNVDGTINDSDMITLDNDGTRVNSAGIVLPGLGSLAGAITTLKKTGKQYDSKKTGDDFKLDSLVCETERQIIFPSATRDKDGNPLTLKGCYENRFRVWKQIQQEF